MPAAVILVWEDGLVKLAIDEAGDVVKRWNLRYFMLLVGSQPTLVYYRKCHHEASCLQALPALLLSFLLCSFLLLPSNCK